jgi:hypothetical protein
MHFPLTYASCDEFSALREHDYEETDAFDHDRVDEETAVGDACDEIGRRG